jgi:RNA polymerase sigma-70 factor (ECF subfamily)
MCLILIEVWVECGSIGMNPPGMWGMDMRKADLCRYFTEHQTYLYRLACTHLYNRMDAEDAVQEAFIRAWLYCESLNKEDAFSSWLNRILINECNNILRHKKHAAEEFIGDDRICLYAAPDEAHITNMDFLDALKNLDDRYRIPIEMIFFQGLTSVEAAVKLHMTRSALSGMVRRGKEKLRAAI